jgi:alpha-tubulin N-acetyltransferase 1
MEVEVEVRFLGPTLPATSASASASAAAAGEAHGAGDIAVLHIAGRSMGRDARLHALLDALGAESARAQSLAVPITTAAKLATAAPEQTALVAYSGHTALGLIKLGRKDLFVARDGTLVELAPLCVLDFFVPVACRRRGVGKVLMDAALRLFATEPRRLAYDRPSHMFLSFLARHYGLTRFTPQANNFVVFDDFWAAAGAVGALPSRGGGGMHAGAPARWPAADAGVGGVASSRSRDAGALGAPTVSVAAARVADTTTVAPATSPYGTTARGGGAGSVGWAGPGPVVSAAIAAPATPTRPPHGGGRFTPAAASAPFATDYNSPPSGLGGGGGGAGGGGGGGAGGLSPYNTRGVRAGGGQ